MAVFWMDSAKETTAENVSAPDMLASDVISPDAAVARQPSTSSASQLLAADIAACTSMHRFLSASLYVSKKSAYWDRLCREVVGCWSLVGCCRVLSLSDCRYSLNPLNQIRID